MEKYGVEEKDPADKTAHDKDVCPKCGEILRAQLDTGVLLCPNCGSAPFEAQPGTK